MINRIDRCFEKATGASPPWLFSLSVRGRRYLRRTTNVLLEQRILEWLEVTPFGGSTLASAH